MSIETYLAELERQLGVGRRGRRRILREIAGHLEDAARQEERAGLTRSEAEARAIARVGSAEALGTRFGEDTRPPSWALSLAAGCAVVGAGVIALALVFTLSGTSGLGTRFVSPRGVRPFDMPGNTETLTYTEAAGGLHNGVVEITVPADWTAPSLSHTSASYGTVSISGKVITVSGATLRSGGTITITTTAVPTISGTSPNIVNTGVIEPRVTPSCPGSVWCRFASNFWKWGAS
jgi:hypothetical protein